MCLPPFILLKVMLRVAPLERALAQPPVGARLDGPVERLGAQPVVEAALAVALLARGVAREVRAEQLRLLAPSRLDLADLERATPRSRRGLASGPTCAAAAAAVLSTVLGGSRASQQC